MTTEEEMMRELHAIRERLYEEIGHMSFEERLEYERRDLAAQVAKYGIKLTRPAAKISR